MDPKRPEVHYPEPMQTTGPASVRLTVDAAGDTHIGGRSNNEDAVALRPELGIYLVADGAGGHEAGNVASALAAATIVQFFERTRAEFAKLPTFDPLGLAWEARRLAQAVQEANDEILRMQRSSQRHLGIGSTLTVLHPVLEARALHLGYVGDSRCYRLRDGRLDQLTDDHTLINDVLELHPDIDEAVVAQLPRNVTTRALGMGERVRVSMRSLELAPGDCYLLCTDGLTRVLDEHQLWQQLREPVSAASHVKTLVAKATEAGPSDNISLVVVTCARASGGDGPVSAGPLGPPRLRARPQPRQIERPATSPSQPPPPPEELDDSPDLEILMLDLEWETDEESSAGVQVVDGTPSDEGELAALRRIIVPMPRKHKRRVPQVTLPHIDVELCKHCGQLVESATTHCPRCGRRR